MGFFWRMWLSAIGIILASAIVFVILATLQFSQIFSGLVGERLLVVASRTAAPFEAATRLGLPLSTVRNADALLAQARQTDTEIAAIYVYDVNGEISHSTQTSVASAEIQKILRSHGESSGGQSWYAESENGFWAGHPISSSGGASAGGILIFYPDTQKNTRVMAMITELAVVAGAIVVFAAVLSGLLMRIGLGSSIRNFERVEADLAQFERDTWRAAVSGEAVADPPSQGFQGLLHGANHQYQRLSIAISRADRDAPE
ncbi:MAG: hypothetical protein ACU0DI_06155 [Paracoccaceae bacterium]